MGWVRIAKDRRRLGKTWDSCMLLEGEYGNLQPLAVFSFLLLLSRPST